jgi:NAD(P)-dependent dehydrogenase (short-subunit alcohol dehydrogenase family)
MDESLCHLFDLGGRAALVTGGSGDIGRTLGRALAAAGADVALNGTSPERLDSARRFVAQPGVRVETFRADVADPEEARRLVEAVCEAFGRLDILVNCAGINIRKPILEVTPEDYEAVMGVNLRGAYFASQAAARVMIRQGGGKIIHIGSLSAEIGLPEISVYGIAKAGLQQLTRIMAVEWAPYNIQVNCLAPGFFRTRLTEGPLWGNERRRRWLESRIPMGRPGQPEELVGALLLLASDASSYITGQTIWVDGGVLAGSEW